MSEPGQARSFDWPGAFLSRLLPSHPAAACTLADTIGSARRRVTRRWPLDDEVRALFPSLQGAAIARTADRIAALNERNRMLVRCILRSGIDPIRPLVSAGAALAALDRPAVLATFHVGALHATGAALETLRRPVLAFRRGILFHPRDTLAIESIEGDEKDRAAALHRAVVHLREGGIVVMAVDESPGDGLPVRCLGHPLALAPGAFALARWTAVPILPLTARWTGAGRVIVDSHDAIRSEHDAAAWLEAYLRESPGELSPGLLRRLLGVS